MFGDTKRKLERERQKRQQLEKNLAHQERHAARMQQAHQQELRQTEQELTNTRLAEEELRKEVEGRQQWEQLQKRAEDQRLEREAQERQTRQRKIQEASPETLSHLRELIRLKYQLDVEIWGLRGARKPDRWLVEEKMQKADAALAEIMSTVRAWEHQADGGPWDAAEWERVQEIQRRLENSRIRVWADSPLWSDGHGDRRGGGGGGAGSSSEYEAYHPR